MLASEAARSPGMGARGEAQGRAAPMNAKAALGANACRKSNRHEARIPVSAGARNRPTLKNAHNTMATRHAWRETSTPPPRAGVLATSANRASTSTARPTHDVIRADFESEEAAALAQLGFNQAIHEEVALGPPGVVFRLAEFEAKTRSVQLVFVLDRDAIRLVCDRGDSQVA